LGTSLGHQQAIAHLLVGYHWLGIPISNPKNWGSSYQQPNMCWDVCNSWGG